MSRTIKEIARHILVKAGWRRGGKHLRSGSRSERFSLIYEAGVWKNNDESNPLSGAGSSLDATGAIRSELPAMLSQLGTRTLLDVGCGDYTWMKETLLPCEYIGVDLVASVVARNQAEYATGRVSFAVADAVTDELPDADTVLCREVLFHLSFADALAALSNIASKPRRFLILTTDRATLFNADILTGDFRLLNLQKRPFRLPPPQFELRDNAVAEERVLGVWRAEDVRNAIGSRGSAGLVAKLSH